MSMLVATNVTKSVTSQESRIDILKGVDLCVNAGESVAIMGVSGTGKTTLLSLLAGLDVPTSGDIIVNGTTISRLSEEERAKQRLGKIGFIFQSFDLLPQLTALENVLLPMVLCKMKNPEEQAKAWLEAVGLSHRLHHFPHQLSGGEQQRVGIARAFSSAPKMIFADEPTGNLDNQTGEKIIHLLLELNKNQGTTLIVVTHDFPLAKRCDSLYQLQNGVLHAISAASFNSMA